MGRMTLQGALRFDVARSWFPEQNIGPDRFLPVAYHFPETKGVDSYKDITPRMGAAIDVFGNGKTALKVNLGKYLEGVGVSTTYANSNPTLRVPSTTGPFGVVGASQDLDRCGCGSGRLTATSPILSRTAILPPSTGEAGRISAGSCQIRDSASRS